MAIGEYRGKWDWLKPAPKGSPAGIFEEELRLDQKAKIEIEIGSRTLDSKAAVSQIRADEEIQKELRAFPGGLRQAVEEKV